MGKGNVGVSPAVSNAELTDSNALVNIANQQNQRSAQLFNEAYPGFATAENFYSTLSTGDPFAISRAIAPAAQQINAASASAKANILANAPNGGEKNLALEQVDVNQGAQIGNTATQGYLGSFNALASLAGQGINQSTSAAGTGISSISAGTQALATLGSQQIQAQEFNAEEKGNTFGSLASLAGTAAEVFAG